MVSIVPRMRKLRAVSSPATNFHGRTLLTYPLCRRYNIPYKCKTIDYENIQLTLFPVARHKIRPWGSNLTSRGNEDTYGLRGQYP